jgi:CBS domain containing-hemolysin-like protein
MDLSSALKMVAVLLLVAANAFFVAAEFALVAARRAGQADTGKPEGASSHVGRAIRDLERTIGGTQLGIAMASLGLGWIAEDALARPLAAAFVELEPPWSSIFTHGAALFVAFAAIVVLYVVLGELVPKTMALLRPERVARAVAPPLNLFNAVMSPVIWLLNRAAAPLVRRTGATEVGTRGRVHSPEEIELLLKQSREEGVVEEDEEEMIHGVFELTRTVAREVMTPRPDIVAFPEDAGLDEVLRVAADSGFSRFPVYRESIDDVTGVALVKDLIRWLQDSDRSDFRLPAVMREPFFVPDTKPVDDLLAEFRRLKLHLAVVVDEFGGTDGVVTLEDLVEEIVGDIYDEHDVPEEEIVLLTEGHARVDGGADLRDVIDHFELGDVHGADEYDTVAGFVIGRLGRIPEPGETVRLGAAKLEVIETQDRRVTTLDLRLVASAGDSPPPEAIPEES